MMVAGKQHHMQVTSTFGTPQYDSKQETPSCNTLEEGSELYKYSDESEKINSQYSQKGSSTHPKISIQSASSKNREQDYEHYNNGMSIKSEDFDQLYKHQRTNELKEMEK